MSENYYNYKGAGYVTLSPANAIRYFDNLDRIARSRGGTLVILHPSRHVVHIPGKCLIASVDHGDVNMWPEKAREAVLIHRDMKENEADFKITAGSNGTVYVNGEKYRTFIVRKVPTRVCGKTVNVVTHESFFDYITAKNLAQ